MSNNNYYCIIPAAGSGQRFGTAIPKQYTKLGRRTILDYALEPFISHPLIKKIVVVIAKDDQIWPSLNYNNHEKIETAVGGDIRYLSVLNGLTHLSTMAQPNDWVLIHDAVRPCITHRELVKLFVELEHHPVGGLLTIPVRDTTKVIDESANIIKTIPRNSLALAQSPQMFRLNELLRAYDTVLSNNKTEFITDEAGIMESVGLQPKSVLGTIQNIKLTVPEDLAFIKTVLRQQNRINEEQ